MLRKSLQTILAIYQMNRNDVTGVGEGFGHKLKAVFNLASIFKNFKDPLICNILDYCSVPHDNEP